MPPVLSIESSGPVIANNAGQPGSFGATRPHSCFRVDDQRGGSARASGNSVDHQLVQFIAFQAAEPGQLAIKICDTGCIQQRTKPGFECIQRPQGNQFLRNMRSVAVMPGLVPEGGEGRQLGGNRATYLDHGISQFWGMDSSGPVEPIKSRTFGRLVLARWPKAQHDRDRPRGASK